MEANEIPAGPLFGAFWPEPTQFSDVWGSSPCSTTGGPAGALLLTEALNEALRPTTFPAPDEPGDWHPLIHSRFEEAAGAVRLMRTGSVIEGVAGPWGTLEVGALHALPSVPGAARRLNCALAQFYRSADADRGV
jgi:hypothetical protein